MNVQSVRSTDPQRLGGLDTRPHYVREGKGNKGVPEGLGCKFHCGDWPGSLLGCGPGWIFSHTVRGQSRSVARFQVGLGTVGRTD